MDSQFKRQKIPKSATGPFSMDVCVLFCWNFLTFSPTLSSAGILYFQIACYVLCFDIMIEKDSSSFFPLYSAGFMKLGLAMMWNTHGSTENISSANQKMWKTKNSCREIFIFPSLWYQPLWIRGLEGFYFMKYSFLMAKQGFTKRRNDNILDVEECICFHQLWGEVASSSWIWDDALHIHYM